MRYDEARQSGILRKTGERKKKKKRDRDIVSRRITKK